MKLTTIVTLLALAAVASAFVNPDAQPVVTEDLIKEIKASGAEWEASINKFADWSIADAKGLCGTKLDHPMKKHAKKVDTIAGAIPASFDARQEWPGAIHPIRDQASCGSCWAFGATEALSDRFAIASNLDINVVLSPQQLVSCDTATGNMGCDGGYLLEAWEYMESTGVLTDGCYPYTSGNGVTGTCKINANTKACPSKNGTFSYYHAASSYYINANAAAIQTEILTNGPIEVGYLVYQDFMSYTSGVYTHKTGALLGGHAVKMIGWGTLNGVAYWTCANSWGTDWGMDGFFLIRRGTDECGIEDDAVAGLADVSSL